MSRIIRSLSNVLALVIVMLVVNVTVLEGQTYHVLYSFGTNAGDPKNPQTNGLMSQGRDGNLYSTTSVGGSFNLGAAFFFTPTGTLTKLSDFKNSPLGGLNLGFDGNLYGTTSTGGTTGAGTVFKITPAGQLTTLWNFKSTDGANPGYPPLQGQDGSFYGSAPGGTLGYGLLYKISSGALSPFATFNATNGNNPNLPTQGTDGNCYGTARFGGVHGYGCGIGCGVLYKVSPNGTVTALHSFGGYPSDGAIPAGVLVQANDGNFYGTTYSGGAHNLGSVFRMTPAGQLTTLYSFCSLAGCVDGKNPYVGLIAGTDGNLYGTSQGGAHNAGAIFKVTPTGTLTVLYSFCSVTACADGFFPQTPLMQHTNGKFYGVTESGGANGLNGGVFYTLDVGLKPFVNVAAWMGRVGKTVGILGQGFTGATTVSFNGTPATFNISSDTYLTAVVPNGATTGPVMVTTTTGSLKSNRKFLVIPTIASFAPLSGPVGTSVVITGTSFTGATVVSFGGVPATSFSVDSDSQITATVPTGAVTGKIQIKTPGGVATSQDSFTVM